MEMEKSEINCQFDINLVVKNELGSENFKKVNDFSIATKELVEKEGFEAHLLLVGGNVKPDKKGKEHKDIDMVLYSPQLATEMYFGGEHPKFDKFAEFVEKAAKRLDWKSEIQDPWFLEHEFCGDGKVILSNEKGKPIEVLPVRKDRLMGSFDEYLKSERDPYVVIF